MVENAVSGLRFRECTGAAGGCSGEKSKAVRLRSVNARTASETEGTNITELVTPTLTLEELIAWVEAQLGNDEQQGAHVWAPRPEWAELPEAA